MMLALLLVLSARAEITVGKFYVPGHVEGEPLFTQRTEIVKNADGRIAQKSKIMNAKGDVVMSEETVMQGLEVVSQKVEQLQSGHVWELSVSGREATFRTSKDRGPASVQKEAVKGTFLTGPVAQAFVQENWDRLLAGEELDVRFGVFEIGGTVGLSMRKKSAGPDGLVVELRPSNIFVRIFVAHLEMTFDNVKHRMIHYRGRTPLRDDKGKPLDMEITYQEVST